MTTTSNVIPLSTALKREDRRLAERRAREDNARRKLMPLVVIACETFRVTADDLLDSQNKHPTVMLARDTVRWLGYTRLHVGTTYLAAALNQHRVGAAHALARIKKKLEASEGFRRHVECIEKLYDAQVRR
jgi:hypothetical protein